jgi:hypothetical protein
LNRDLIEEKGERNLYTFVVNNPVNNTDFLGLKLSAAEQQCCKCLVFAKGEDNPFPSSKNEDSFCAQAKKSKTFTAVNTDKFRYCMGQKCKVDPTKLEKKLFDQEIGSAAKACDGLGQLGQIPAGAYYWWNPDISPTNEGIMAWNIKIGNCTENTNWLQGY